MREKPEAIMINVPESFFEEKISQEGFERFYHSMNEREGSCFHHFIATIPVHEVIHVYVCYRGQVRFRANIAQFIRNGVPDIDDEELMIPRNWVTTCAPVVAAPKVIVQRGFRGFRYCEKFF